MSSASSFHSIERVQKRQVSHVPRARRVLANPQLRPRRVAGDQPTPARHAPCAITTYWLEGCIIIYNLPLYNTMTVTLNCRYPRKRLKLSFSLFIGFSKIIMKRFKSSWILARSSRPSINVLTITYYPSTYSEWTSVRSLLRWQYEMISALASTYLIKINVVK